MFEKELIMAKKGSKARALKRAQMEAALGILSESNVVAMDSTEELEIAPVTVHTDEQPSAIYATDDDEEMQFASEKVEESEAEEIQAAADSEAEEIQAVTQSDVENEVLESEKEFQAAAELEQQERQAVTTMVPPVSPTAMPKAADIAAVLDLTEQLAAVELEAKKKEEKPKAKKTKKFKKDNTENEELDQKIAAEAEKALSPKEKALMAEKAEHEAEIKALQEQENVILENFAQENFKPASVPRGYFEKDDAYKARNEIAQAKQRLDFIAQNKEKVLLEALRSAIRQNASAMPEGEQVLNKEEELQARLGAFYGKRADERRQDVEKVRADRNTARYYAPAPVAPKKHISNDAPGLNLSVGRHFGIQWQSVLARELQKSFVPKVLNTAELEQRQKMIAENQAASAEASRINKNITDGRTHGRVKREDNSKYTGTVYEPVRPLFTPKPTKMKP
jgi:hypothetical protein